MLTLAGDGMKIAKLPRKFVLSGLSVFAGPNDPRHWTALRFMLHTDGVLVLRPRGTEEPALAHELRRRLRPRRAPDR